MTEPQLEEVKIGVLIEAPMWEVGPQKIIVPRKKLSEWNYLLTI